MKLHTDLECPVCHDWVEILPTTPTQFWCPWCKEPLTIGENRLESARDHIEKMIQYSKDKDYYPDESELINENPPAGEGEE